MALGKAAKGALDLGLVRVTRNTEHVVVVAFDGHGGGDDTNWHS
jgi:hypothetical protein